MKNRSCRQNKLEEEREEEEEEEEATSSDKKKQNQDTQSPSKYSSKRQQKQKHKPGFVISFSKWLTMTQKLNTPIIPVMLWI